MDKKLLFIYNAKSGKAKIRNKLVDIIDVFIKAGYRVESYQTQCPMDASAKIAKDGVDFDMIVCSGGDGTLNEVVSGTMKLENKPIIGYIPSGSTNDFGKTLGLYKDMVKSAKVAVNGRPVSVDVGEFNGNKNFVYIAAFGVFTDVSYQTPQNMKNILGHQAYIIEGIKSLPSIKAYRMKVEYENGRFEDEFIYGMISNSESAGGFKGISGKNVILDDGLYEGTFIRKPRSPIELTSIINSIISGNIKSDAIYNFKTSKIKITSKEPVSWTIDGEFGGEHTEVNILNHMNAIQIMAHLHKK
ncbi:MAG: YegS/Rv2252/BmrU family lipid kinase [Lachnospiraceae bacterium]|nr:YegS/Rv2252/BmrU family lipid kinase [Lachnospiraceae bacterium]